MSLRRAVQLGLLLLAPLAGGCSLVSKSLPDYAPSSGPYDRLPEDDRQRVVRARELIETHELERARAVLAEVLGRRPQNMAVASLLQDVDLLLAEEPGGGHPSAGELARQALDDARRAPSPVSLLLAARIAPDRDLARGLMDEAIELDPDCAWAHYALAWSLATEGRWHEAQRRVELALALDPGHLSARRLEAGLMARDGDADTIDAFELWLRITEDEPLVDPAARLAAKLDLAQLHLLDGHERRAREVLLSLADEAPTDARRECLLAAAEHADGHRRRALAAARRAAEAAPDDPLPMVQQALLLEDSFGDPAAARAAWERVLELSRKESDLAALILGMRARVALERSSPSVARAEAAAEIERARERDEEDASRP